MFLPLLGFGSRAELVRTISGKRAFPEGERKGGRVSSGVSGGKAQQ